jgi:hypothetical protein
MPYQRARPLPLAAILALGMLTAGCAGDGQVTRAFNLGNPFQGPSEDGFLERVRHYCAAFPIGDSTVGSLLATDPTFQSMTSRLYRGDLSNDGFAFQVLELHPANDANVPGTGCMINELDACFAGRCQVPDTPAATAPLPPTENTEDAAMAAPIDNPPAEPPTPLP